MKRKTKKLLWNILHPVMIVVFWLSIFHILMFFTVTAIVFWGVFAAGFPDMTADTELMGMIVTLTGDLNKYLIGFFIGAYYFIIKKYVVKKKNEI